MRLLAQKVIASPKKLAKLSKLALLKIMKPSRYDPCAAICGTRGKVVTLDQQNTLSSLSTLAGESHTVYAATNNGDVHAFGQWASSREAEHMWRLDARQKVMNGLEARNSARLASHGLRRTN
jgi:hypothetical protein